jgi:hypothetical protein
MRRLSYDELPETVSMRGMKTKKLLLGLVNS